MANLTANRLRELLECDPETGMFTWKVDVGSRIRAGDPAANRPASGGYVYVQIDGRSYRRGRLVWFYVHGNWPVNHMDHINCVKTDDRIINLRDATRSQNMANRKRAENNRSGYKGIRFHKRDKLWQAKLQLNGRTIPLGFHKTPEAAYAAYCAGAAKYHGEFARIA